MQLLCGRFCCSKPPCRPSSALVAGRQVWLSMPKQPHSRSVLGAVHHALGGSRSPQTLNPEPQGQNGQALPNSACHCDNSHAHTPEQSEGLAGLYKAVGNYWSRRQLRPLDWEPGRADFVLARSARGGALQLASHGVSQCDGHSQQAMDTGHAHECEGCTVSHGQLGQVSLERQDPAAPWTHQQHAAKRCIDRMSVCRGTGGLCSRPAARSRRQLRPHSPSRKLLRQLQRRSCRPTPQLQIPSMPSVSSRVWSPTFRMLEYALSLQSCLVSRIPVALGG